MKCLLSCVAAIMICGLVGCQSNKPTVMTLTNQDGATPYNQTMKVTQKGTYYLYSSKDPRTALYHTDLKKGDEIGFHVSGSRAQAMAKGTLIELPEDSEGAVFTWQWEEKKD